MKAHMWGSTLVADGKVYVGDEDGDFVVLAASKEKKLLSETNLGAPIYSTPVVANGVHLRRQQDAPLRLLRSAADGTPPARPTAPGNKH